jgi:hypothetical protein
MKAVSNIPILVGIASLVVTLSAEANVKVDAEASARTLFPGVMQTNLVANKPEFGAQILEPNLRDAWGIAIRPAGFGGHFWIPATGRDNRFSTSATSMARRYFRTI